MIDPYLYTDCPVLKNKLGIKDGALLDKAEVDFSCNAINDLLTSPINGNYDFDHLCKFHAFIFGDVYDWAGLPRTVSMEKQEAVLGYMSIIYAQPKDIEHESIAVLAQLRKIKWLDLEIDELMRLFSDGLATLWKIHPFREGNTRTIITFMCQFIEKEGIPLDRKLFERNAAFLRSALVAATAVFQDGDYRNSEYLYKIVKNSIERGRSIDL
ncbi:MAG: Fic family protein [Oscillospiraceae bacterium]|nr:Fic family protein [Oscillospiraceae bacterium]